MKLVLLCAHQHTDSWVEEVEDLYKGKISHFLNLEIIRLRNKKLDREDKVSRAKNDSEQILNFISENDYLVLLDEGGKALSSEKFANEIEKILNTGKKRIVFCVGGPYGVDEKVKKIAKLSISLSTMVMNHQIAEVVTLEQIYRAFTIIKNIPYHNK